MIPPRLQDVQRRATVGDDNQSTEQTNQTSNPSPGVIDGTSFNIPRDQRTWFNPGFNLQQQALVPVARGVLKPYLMPPKPRANQTNPNLIWVVSNGRYVLRKLPTYSNLDSPQETPPLKTIYTLMSSYSKPRAPFDGSVITDINISIKPTLPPQQTFLNKPLKKSTNGNISLNTHPRLRKKQLHRKWIINTRDKNS